MTTAHWETKTCIGCGQTFETGYGARFCSKECGFRNGRRVLAAEQFAEPDRPAVMEPLKRCYEAVCMACARVQGDPRADLMLDNDQARGMRRLERCRWCGGVCHLERVLLTSGVGR